MNIPYVLKKCSTCGRWLVASTDNFYRQKGCKYNLTGECKECRKKQRKQYYKANKEKESESRKQYYEANKDKILEYHKQWYEDNKDKKLEYNKQWYKDNKEKMAEWGKQYYEANKEKAVDYHKQYHEANKKKIADYHKQWYQNNRERELERVKQYRQTPQGQVVSFNGCQRRRVKEKQQGTGITKDQWLEMMSFFDWKCAYSGEYLGGSNNSFNRTIDHIVPLNSGGDNMIWNCVPMTRNLNSSKKAKDMLEWYRGQDFYDPKRLQKIYEWQEYAYNKWGKDTEYFNTNDIQITLL